MAEKAGLAGARKPIWIATTISVVWLAVLVWLLWESESCQANGTPIVLYHFDTWLTCRSANEVGDFLAGAFAPLAFIWLAVAVFIQSMELAAQREELRMAREEAKGTRMTLEAQTEESRKNVRLIQKQTEIIEKDKEIRDLTHYETQIDKYIDFLGSFFREAVIVIKIDEVRLATIRNKDLSNLNIIRANSIRIEEFTSKLPSKLFTYSEDVGGKQEAAAIFDIVDSIGYFILHVGDHKKEK